MRGLKGSLPSQQSSHGEACEATRLAPLEMVRASLTSSVVRLQVKRLSRFQGFPVCLHIAVHELGIPTSCVPLRAASTLAALANLCT
jgi:hypothetical protein